MPTVEPTNTIVRTAENVRVYIRRRWTDAWTAAPWLYCNYAESGVSPKIPAAGFSYRYGLDKYPVDAEFTAYSPQALDDWHVMVEVEQLAPAAPWVWCGQLHESGTTPEGSFPGGPFAARCPSGSVDLVAVDYLSLLNGESIITSWYSREGNPQWLGVALPFNERNHRLDRGNRTAEVAGNGVHLFAGALDAATDCKWWSTRDIVLYLLAMHPPLDPAGNVACRFSVAPDRLQYLPTWDRPAIALHGQNVKAILDQLLSPARLLGYWVGPDPDPAGNRIPMVFPFTALDVAAPIGGVLFPANSNPTTLDLSTARDVSNPVIKSTSSIRYDQIVLLGQRVLCCGTLSSRQTSLVAKWSPAERDRYNQGASKEANYPNPLEEPALCDEANKEARSREANARVFAHFGLPDDWDGKVGDGQMVAPWPAEWLFPFAHVGLQGTPQDQAAVWYRPYMRFAHHLPLVDEEASAMKRAKEYRKPYVLVRDFYGLVPSTLAEERYAEIDKFGKRTLHEQALVDVPMQGTQAPWSASVTAHEYEPTLILKVSGAEQHVLAKGEFVPCDASDLDIAEYDWRDNIMATVALESFLRAAAYYPESVAGIDRDTVRRKIIEFDHRQDQGRAWWIAKGTVLGLGPDQKPIRQANSQWLVDDRPYMRDLARMAYSWFGPVRQTISFAYSGAQQILHLGDLITGIIDGPNPGDAPVDWIVPGQSIRTVVTEIRIEFGQHMEQTHQTHVATSYGELDVLQFA